VNTAGRQDSILNPNLRIPFLGILLLLSILLDFLQCRFLPLYLNLDWTLIFVFYIGWSTNSIKGGFAGTVFGIAQDFLLGVMLGLNGAIKTIIGYSASYLSTILNPDLAGIMRFVLIAVISLLNNLILHKSQHILSNSSGEIPILMLLASSLLTGIAGDLLFRLLNRLKSDPKQFIH
jgi:rod shape-determining protein MreD